MTGVNIPLSRRGLPRLGALARLVRLPSVLTVPGDVLLGQALAGRRQDGGKGLVAASALLYLAGMALNDYADREVDAVERPERPIPVGEVRPGVALTLATGLTLGALTVAGRAGGRRALRVAVPLAATVWAYDLAVKATPLGPPAMATARALNVMLGACEAPSRAAGAAMVTGAHTLAITIASRREVEGTGPALPAGVLTAATTIASVAACRLRRPQGHPSAPLIGAACLGGYLLSVYDAAGKAMKRPGPAEMQRLVGTGVLALIPLQASLLAAVRRPGTAVAVLAAWPLARLAARKAVVT